MPDIVTRKTGRSTSYREDVDLVITEIDSAFLKIDCEESIARELSDDFTFMTPGYQHHPLFKKRIWDGKIRLFQLKKRMLYSGLGDKLRHWCKIKNYTYSYVPAKYYISLDHVDRKVTKSGIEARPYQIELYNKCMDTTRAVILSPTASGKSLIIYFLARDYFELGDGYNLSGDGRKALIIVPTINLVNQMFNDFVSYDPNTEQHIHRIYGGQDVDSEKKIIISTWQSIYQLPESWFEKFRLVIGDECHLFKAKSLVEIMTKLKDCYLRYGFTGSLDKTEVHELVLTGLFGPVIEGQKTKELQDQGYLSELEIKVIILEYPKSDRVLAKDLNYQDETDFIVTHAERLLFLKKLALVLEGSSFILFRFVDKHGIPLYESIRKEKGDAVRLVYGNTPADEREVTRNLANISGDFTAVASYGVFSTGVNVPNLNNIVLGSPYKSRIKVLQSIGRVLRKTEQKTKAVVYDIVDDLTCGNHTNHSVKHYFERLKIYNQEGFNYKIIKVPLPANNKKKLEEDAQSKELCK